VTDQANRTFKGIAEAKKRSVRLGNPIRLSVGGVISHMDMRMSETKSQVFPSSMRTYSLLTTQLENKYHGCFGNEGNKK
jgi:anaphase-promoting complex subunit 4